MKSKYLNDVLKLMKLVMTQSTLTLLRNTSLKHQHSQKHFLKYNIKKNVNLFIPKLIKKQLMTKLQLKDVKF